MKPKDAETVRTYAGQQVDAIGLQCPLPVLKLQKALRRCAIGERVMLLATDPASQIDVPHFCNETGHILLTNRREADTFIYEVECKALPSAV
jgi:tRNA 2-thiouridine synthesizing protein A